MKEYYVNILLSLCCAENNNENWFDWRYLKHHISVEQLFSILQEFSVFEYISKLSVKSCGVIYYEESSNFLNWRIL